MIPEYTVSTDLDTTLDALLAKHLDTQYADTCEVCDKPIRPGEDFDRCCGHVVHYRCLPVFTVYRHFTFPIPATIRKPLKTKRI